MSKTNLILVLITAVLHSQLHSQAKTSAMADGNSAHTSSGSSVVSSSTSSYSTSGTAPAHARPEEAFAYQLQQAKEIAMKINERRIQRISDQIHSIQFNNPFQDKEPESGFSDWDKEKSKYVDEDENSDYSTLSPSSKNVSQFSSGYLNPASLPSRMTTSSATDFSEKQLDTKSSPDIKNEFLQQVADKTIDETINSLEDEDVKSRLQSIKEIHNDTYDLFEKEVDDFFKPYSPEVQARIDGFFGTYRVNVFQSFLNANPFIREQTDDMKKQASRVEMVFGVYNYLRL